MLLYKNRLIFGIVRKIISTALHAVYSVVALFNLQLVALVLVIGCILFFTGVLDNDAVLLVFRIALIASVAFAIYKSIKKLLGIDNKKHTRGGGAQIIKSPTLNAVEENISSQSQNAVGVQPTEQVGVNVQTPQSVVPRYFRVRQNSNYVMAEYPDRYELFRLTEQGMTKIRTDYK